MKKIALLMLMPTLAAAAVAQVGRTVSHALYEKDRIVALIDPTSIDAAPKSILLSYTAPGNKTLTGSLKLRGRGFKNRAHGVHLVENFVLSPGRRLVVILNPVAFKSSSGKPLIDYTATEDLLGNISLTGALK